MMTREGTSVAAWAKCHMLDCHVQTNPTLHGRDVDYYYYYSIIIIILSYAGVCIPYGRYAAAACLCRHVLGVNLLLGEDCWHSGSCAAARPLRRWLVPVSRRRHPPLPLQYL
jgi:hypothetical protein